MDEYTSTGRHHIKQELAAQIFRRVQETGGRCLRAMEPDEKIRLGHLRDDVVWVECTEQDVLLNKIKQTFRDMAKARDDVAKRRQFQENSGNQRQSNVLGATGDGSIAVSNLPASTVQGHDAATSPMESPVTHMQSSVQQPWHPHHHHHYHHHHLQLQQGAQSIQELQEQLLLRQVREGQGILAQQHHQQPLSALQLLTLCTATPHPSPPLPDSSLGASLLDSIAQRGHWPPNNPVPTNWNMDPVAGRDNGLTLRYSQLLDLAAAARVATARRLEQATTATNTSTPVSLLPAASTDASASAIEARGYCMPPPVHRQRSQSTPAPLYPRPEVNHGDRHAFTPRKSKEPQ